MSSSAHLLTDSRYAGMEPVAPQNRILCLDVVRGLGVLGILLVNIESFAMLTADRTLPVAPGDKELANLAIWFLTHVLADGKFMTVFSLLFGAGICLMFERSEREGGNLGHAHFRRMGFLMLIGVLHAHLLWSGDILFAYGVCGSVCWFLRRLSPARLSAVGACSLFIGSMISWNVSSSDHGYLVDLYRVLQDCLHIHDTNLPVRELLTYRGGWLEQMTARVPAALNAEFVAFWLLNFWRISGVFLLGMALFKTGFRAGSVHKVVYRAALSIAAAAAFASACVGCVELWLNSASAKSLLVDFTANYWLSVPIGIGWVAIGSLIASSSTFKLVQAPLQVVGRMAFTNYILQTIICTTLFYGHGLRLFGSLDRMHLLALVLLIWIAEILVSRFWLRRFAYGPIEWLQRYVAYWRRPPACLPAATTTTL
jgi:uncharacterized protein